MYLQIPKLRGSFVKLTLRAKEINFLKIDIIKPFPANLIIVLTLSFLSFMPVPVYSEQDKFVSIGNFGCLG